VRLGRRGQARQSRQSFLTRERRLKGNGVMLDFGIEKLFRDAAIFLHMDATADVSRFKIVKAMFPHTAGTYAGPE
jgi:alkylation response protein AidB-like acyl-CoA dehydrogenase